MPYSNDTPPKPPRPPLSSSPWFWLALLIGLSVLLIWFLEDQYPGTLSDPDKQVSVLGKMMWLALLVPALLIRWRSRPKSSLRHAAIWLLIFSGLMAVMTFREDASYIANRVMGAASPASGQETADGGITFTRNADGHFVIRADVNGSRVVFLLDTGATDIVLAPHDAARLGYDPAKLEYDKFVSTANGMGRAASVSIQNLVVGPIAMGSMRVSVNAEEMSESLLGMAFLNRLSSWRVDGDRLTLYP